MTLLTGNWPNRIRKQALDLGLYGHADYTAFIVLGRSRVGSNLLRGLLNGHPQVAAFGEIFRDVKSLDWDHLGYFQSRALASLAERDPVRLLDRSVFGRYPDSIRAVGFKLFYYHAREGAAASIWPYLRERPRLKVIHLRRENLLQTHVSRKRAALTDQWVNVSGQPEQQVVLRLDYDECLEDFERTRSWEDDAGRFFEGHPFHDVTYERLAGEPQSEAEAIQQFLGVPVRPLRPSTHRQARQSLSATIANYAELKAQFSGTPWQAFFSD
jgi:LPS sulfotransferase NodH